MIKEGKIGVQEAICLIVITSTVKIFFTSATYVAKILGTTGWYMTLISAITATVGFTFIYFLLKRYPGKDIIQAFEMSLGKILGFIFSMILSAFLFFNTALLIREFIEITKIYTLIKTPPGFLIGTLLATVTGTCFLGLETIARISKLFIYIFIGGFLLIIILAYKDYDFYNLLPLLGYGLDKTIFYGVSRSSFYGEVIILGVIASTIQGVSHIKKAGYISLLISGIIISLSALSTMLAFNYHVSSEITSLMYALSRTIEIGDFIQNLDPLTIFIWNIGTLIGTSTLFYASLSIYCKSFKINDMRPLIIPFAIILFAVSMIPKDLQSVVETVHKFRQYGWTIFFGLPLVALLAAIIRNKKGDINA